MKFQERVLIAILFTILILALIGCTAVSTQAKATSDTRFKVINAENDGAYTTATAILVDNETGVMYLFARSGYGGGLTVMLDETGAPLIWEGT